jgi:hypothetical protein
MEALEAVAVMLFQAVAYAEGKQITEGQDSRTSKPDRQWILDTFAECLNTVQGPNEQLNLSVSHFPKPLPLQAPGPQR